MNKLFFILALGVFMPAELCAQNYIDDNGAFVLAKAVKLGRGSAYSVAADAKINGSGAGGTINTDKTCDSHCADCNTSTGNCNSCAEGYYLKNGKCGSCPANATCSNGETFICKDYYYKSGDSCQAICSGVSCKSGYKTAAATDSCCCEKDNGCSALQVYNTTIKKCVDAVCPVGCLDSCINGCGSCESGRYLNYSNGYCPLCSSAIANCETCTSSALGPTCTACASGYSLSNGKCVANAATCSAGYYLKNGVCTACASGTYSKGGTATSCSSCSTIYAGGSNITCTSCTTTGTCTGSNTALDCSVCTSGYTKNLTSCPSGQTLQQGPICVNSGFTCGKCVSKSSSGSTSCSSGQTYRTVKPCSASTISYTGCFPTDYGNSCSSSSQCSSRLCAPCSDAQGNYLPQGSTCR